MLPLTEMSIHREKVLEYADEDIFNKKLDMWISGLRRMIWVSNLKKTTETIRIYENNLGMISKTKNIELTFKVALNYKTCGGDYEEIIPF